MNLTLGKDPGGWWKFADMVAFRSLEKIMAHAKWNCNAQIAMTDNGERDKKAQGSGHARVDISCEARRPTRGLHSRGYTIQWDYQECTDERDTRINKFSSDSVPQAVVDTREGCHRAQFIKDKVLEAIKDKW